MDVATGALERWSAAPGVTLSWIEPSRDGALIVANGTSPDEWCLFDRTSGKTWRVEPGLKPHIGIGYGTVIGAWTDINNGRLVVLDVAAGTALEVDYTRPNQSWAGGLPGPRLTSTPARDLSLNSQDSPCPPCLRGAPPSGVSRSLL